jgi:NADPH:quinone reductase-like Zn-dependent oxidoreductase
MKKCNNFQVRVRVSACSLNPVDAKVKPLLFLPRISRRSQPLLPQAAQWKGMSPDMTSAHVCGLDVSGDKPFSDPSPPAAAALCHVETELSYCR